MAWCMVDTLRETTSAEAAPVPVVVPSEPYLGQTLPGAEPRTFAYGIINGALHSAPAFAPDGSTVYWSAYDDSGTYTNALRRVNGYWNSLSRMELIEGIDSYSEPYITNDGRHLFFITTAPIDADSPLKENIWVAERDGDSWVNAQPLPAIINDLHIHWSFSVSDAGDLYFAAGEDGFNDLYVSRLAAGRYTTPQKLAAPVNTDEYELTPAIAPDGSYLLFSRMPTLSGTPRLYITYALPGGLWSAPVRIENTGYAVGATLSPDGKYVFYLGGEEFVNWRDTSFIDELHPKLNWYNDPYRIKKDRDPLTRLPSLSESD
jgi:Tol biopolymer transport system component